jgi:gluconolactonase
LIAGLILMALNQSFVAPGAEVVKLPGTYLFTEGPCWIQGNQLIFSDIPASKIYTFDGKDVTIWRDGTDQANGNTLDSNGAVLSCKHGSRSVDIYAGDGSKKSVAAEFGGKKLNSPNDIAIHSSGAVVFTDPSYGIRDEQMEQDGKYVYELREGKLRQIYKGRNQPNGLVFSPDGRKLYLADSGDGGIEIFDYSPGGVLKDGKHFDSPGPDGVRVDQSGRVWAACGDGVNVYSPSGDLLENIKFPEQPANLCFGGVAGDVLYVTARTGVYSLKLSVRGVMPGF